MKKFIFLAKRREGMTHEQFREHYENSHAQLALKHFGKLLINYRRNYVRHVSGIPTPTGAPSVAPDFDYDVITEFTLIDDAAHAEWERLVGDPELSLILAEDEARFIDRKDFLMIDCEEVDTGTTFHPS